MQCVIYIINQIHSHFKMTKKIISLTKIKFPNHCHNHIEVNQHKQISSNTYIFDNRYKEIKRNQLARRWPSRVP